MKTLHKLSIPVIGVMAAVALAGCSLLAPEQPTTPDTPDQTEAPAAVSAEDLNDTSWAGTDSEGTDTTFTFHEGGSTAVSFSGNPYDDPGDTWALDGSKLTITIYNVEGVGDAIYTGEVTDPAGPIDLDLSFTDITETRTLTITKG
ncbi:MAG TPA: hypothetical protein VNR36_00920 [Pseudolysinimonas sp.]|nr:hypothetical protein [Pseudolysinimonas sp.]